MPEPEVVFFRTPAEWRAWLEGNAAEGVELWVGFFKRGAGESGITWPQAVDQALCFGWIDGRRQSIDDTRYRIRFTERKTSSIWSTVNVARVAELTAEGLMQEAGLEAFARRREERSGVYSQSRRASPSSMPSSWRSSRDGPRPGRSCRRRRRRTARRRSGGSSTPSAPRRGRAASRR